MSARKELRGGKRPGAGRPKGTGGPPELVRRNRVVAMLTDAEFEKLQREAKASQVPLGTMAYEAICAFLNRVNRKPR